MKPYYEDSTIQLWHGANLDVLPHLGDGSIDCGACDVSGEHRHHPITGTALEMDLIVDTADALFPPDAPTLTVHGPGPRDIWVLRACARCHAVVRLSDAREHARWHGEAS